MGTSARLVLAAVLVVAPMAMTASALQTHGTPSVSPRPPAKKQQPAPHRKTPKVSSMKMHKFAHAYLNLTNVRSRYLVKLQKTKDPKKAAKIKAQAVKAEKKTIRKFMRLRDYIKIGKEIDSSVILRRRFLAILQGNRAHSPQERKHGARVSRRGADWV